MPDISKFDVYRRQDFNDFGGSPEAVAKRIVQGVCELQEIPDPDHHDTIMVTVGDLEAVICNHLPASPSFPQPRRKDGGEPCGECHIQPGETCDICGAKHAARQAQGGEE